jgi:excinuclease ABC subunit A
MKLDFGVPGRIVFSQKFACPVSGFTIAEIEPRLFSFNAPQGACPACDGLGEKLVFDEDLVVPNHNLSIAKGAVDAVGQVAAALALLHAGAAQPRPRL